MGEQSDERLALHRRARADARTARHDAPYGRPSNFPFTITVSKLDLRLPTHERPGAVPQVGTPATPFLPKGATPTAVTAKAIARARRDRHRR